MNFVTLNVWTEYFDEAPLGSSTATRWQVQAVRQGKMKIIHLFMASTFNGQFDNDTWLLSSWCKALRSHSSHHHHHHHHHHHQFIKKHKQYNKQVLKCDIWEQCVPGVRKAEMALTTALCKRIKYILLSKYWSHILAYVSLHLQRERETKELWPGI